MKRLCVFCAAKPGVRPAYLEAARQLGRVLVENRIGLVYGGAGLGAMGVIADTVQDLGGEVIGVIPRSMVEKEEANARLTDLRVVESLHQRKALMADLADGFIALPGGLGTLEEFFEIAAWAQLELHRKPCGLLNICGYYDGLIAFLDHAVAEGLIRQKHRDNILVAETATDIIAQLQGHYASSRG